MPTTCIQDTESVDLEVSVDGQLTADVIISPDALNALSIHSNGLYAPYPWLTGEIKIWSTSTAPTGWLMCDGSAINRSTYATLFAVVGTTFGSGDGSTTFNVPNFRGRMPVGLGTHTDIDAIGENEGVATDANRRPKHKHTAHTHTVPDHRHGMTDVLNIPDMGNHDESGGFNANTNGVSADLGGAALTTSSKDGGSGVSTDSLDAPAYLTVAFIIKT